MRRAGILALVLLSACGGGANFTLYIDFPNEEVKTRIDQVEIWVLRTPEVGS